MSKINILSSKVYNRIAAGEVVERPASVVKELVENSIDAGATEISVEIRNGGTASVKVTDNGCGIEKSELKKAVLPHATSKICKAEDLDAISSLGFRGEALASIASVSKLTIITKPENQEAGAKLYTEGGDGIEITDYASAVGTEITVSNLFFNTPARERFLKTDKAEEGEVTACMTRLILGNPQIAFTYTANDKIIYRSFGDGLNAAFATIYGVNTIKDCFYIDSEKNGVKIRGFIGKHYFTKPNKTYQSIFLNGRYIVNSTVSAAISNAYSAYLMKRQYPFYVLSIEVPHETVDVNVHPNKIDVRFSDNRIVYVAVYSVVSKVLDGSSEALNIVADNFEKKPQLKPSDTPQNYATHNEDYRGLKNAERIFDKAKFCDSGKKTETTFDFKESVDKIENTTDIFAENKAFLDKLEKDKAAGKINSEDVFSFKAEKEEITQSEIKIDRELKYIGQALNTYLIFDDGADMYFIDQHAAHERIIFDRLNEQIKANDVETQLLLLPYVFDVGAAEAEFLREKLGFLNSMGIEISEFGDFTFKVSAIPVIIADINLKSFFDELLSDLNALKNISVTDILKEKIAQKACKSAIKSGDKLNERDTEIILKEIKCNLGLKCPHGRPIAVKITRTEIDKWFKRIV